MGILETILGVIAGGLGSWVGKVIGIYERKQTFAHEIHLLEMQMKAQRAETESELAIAREDAFASMREASYVHDASVTAGSASVNNALRLVRPFLTIMLIGLVCAIWMTIAKDDVVLQHQIVDGVLFMASTALAWWFGDRAPHSKKLPWQ